MARLTTSDNDNTHPKSVSERFIFNRELQVKLRNLDSKGMPSVLDKDEKEKLLQEERGMR